MISLVVGPLKGLAYLVLLPLAGIVAIFLLGLHRLATLRKPLLKSSFARRDYNSPRKRHGGGEDR